MYLKKLFGVKFCLLALVCGVAMLTFAPQSQAALRVEDFDSYADGSLLVAGSPKWMNQSGTLFEMQVLNNEAVVDLSGALSEDLRMEWNINDSGTGDIYVGLDVRVTGPLTDPNSTDAEYFAHFINKPFNFNTRMDVNPPQGGGDFTIGIASDDSVADALWGTDLSFNTSYRIVARYNQTDNQAELWINPVTQASTSILGDDQPDANADINQGFGLRQSGSGYDETVYVDNIAVSLSFAEALAGTPEPSTFALLLLGVAGMATRRRL